MPLVILEGPDGSGKSTLAARLLKGTGYPTLLLKRSGPPGDIETLLFQTMWIRDQSNSGLNLIVDRHPIISECIYKPIVRKQGPAPWSLHDAVRDFPGKDLLIVYCRTEFATMNETRKVEEQMAGVAEYFRPLVEEYDRWMSALTQAGVEVHVYDFKDDPKSESAIDTVRAYWEKRRG